MAEQPEAVAFQLREEYAGTVEQDGEQVPVFQGANFAQQGGQMFDVGEELDDGDGTIVVSLSDPYLIEQLRAVHCLKQVPVPEGAVPRSAFEQWPVARLREELDRRDLPKGGNKAELVERLKAHDEALATGDSEAAMALAGHSAGAGDNSQGD